MSLTTSDVETICGLVSDLCGIYLDDSKAYLIESRLGDLVKSNNCASYTELAQKVKTTNDRALKNSVIDAITTNETLFFRDIAPFEALKFKIVPEIIDSKSRTTFPKRLRFWSAACSTGQEVYSLAISLHEMLPDVHSWDIQILGTDISDAAVARASRGWYKPHEIERGMSQDRLQKFFRQEDGGWRVSDELRSMATFSRQNLLEPFGMTNRFDVVFCRNVAIYFTPEVRKQVFERVAATLTPEGYLFAGSQESLADLGDRFKPQFHCRATTYQPNLTVLSATRAN
jgi:chemotaxis protein methyltransferase CheR